MEVQNILTASAISEVLRVLKILWHTGRKIASLQYKRLHKKGKCHLVYLSEEIIKVFV